MKPLVDSVQFFNSAILAKFNIVSLRRRSFDYPPTQHCAQNASPLWNVAQTKFYAHTDLKNLEGTLVLSLTISSSRWQRMVSVLIIAEGAQEEQKSQTKFLPFLGFEPQTSRLAVQHANHWTTTNLWNTKQVPGRCYS